MIPKKLHYCWFGKNVIPKELQNYLNGWRETCPDYEVILWSEDNFDVAHNGFVEKAYKDKKFAFVSDYVRAYALYNHGGIYLDTDVELRRPLDEFLTNSCFSGFESKGSPFTAVWGAEEGHLIPKLVMQYYEETIYNSKRLQTNTSIVSEILISKYGIIPEANIQQIGRYLNSEVTIYPAEYFCIDLPTSYAVHHFYGSWIKGSKSSVKESVNSNYHFNMAIDKINQKDLIKPLGRTISIGVLASAIIRAVYYRVTPKFLDEVIRSAIK